jgi:hypothetical protein
VPLVDAAVSSLDAFASDGPFVAVAVFVVEQAVVAVADIAGSVADQAAVAAAVSAAG